MKFNSLKFYNLFGHWNSGIISRHFSTANTSPVEDKGCENVPRLLSTSCLFFKDPTLQPFPHPLSHSSLHSLFNFTIQGNFHIMCPIPQTLGAFVDYVLALECFFFKSLFIFGCVWSYLPHSMWDLSSLPRDWTHLPHTGKQIINYRAIRKSLECFWRCGRSNIYCINRASWVILISTPLPLPRWKQVISSRTHGPEVTWLLVVMFWY